MAKWVNDLSMSATIKLSSRPTGEFWEISVLHEDEHLLALDKPSGLLTSPDRDDPDRPNLTRLLHAAIAEGKPWARERGLSYLMNAHRLDFETSGVILLAKSKPVLVQLADLFGSEKPARKYGALVQGEPPAAEFESNARLAPHPANPAIIRVDQKRGKKALTLFEVRERFDGWSWLECRPLTGRTHQIRVHLRSLRLPIVGDALYGGKPLWLSRLKSDYRLKPDREERPLIGRLALHAKELALTHPVTGQVVSVAAPLPNDIVVGLKYLRKYAPSQMTKS
jgi:RluA family pseudouridine synthase